MLGTMRLQGWIHRLEEGGGARILRWLVALFGFAMIGVLYNTLCLRNFSNPEAMDAAQLARNISQGQGYKTDCVRPFSLYLSAQHSKDTALPKEGHRDISNAPLYPLLLAPLLRFTPPDRDLIHAKSFTIYGPDLYIILLNQLLLGLGTLLVFKLALGWFDRTVAWLSALLFALTELYWRFSMSGLSTVLLMDLVLVLAWLLSRFESASRENAGPAKMFLLAGGIGLVTALAMLTRYSMGWLIIPATIFVLACSTRRGIALAGIVLVTFAAVGVPWLMRNAAASGWPFGTATFAPLSDTRVFPGDLLERSLSPSFTGLPGYRSKLTWAAVDKGVIHLREILVNDLPRSGGNWLWAFFLAGLLVRFQNQNLARVRWFVVGAIALLIPVQAVTRTHLSTELPQVNSENLLVVLSPLILIFGAGFFLVLLGSWQGTTAAWHYSSLAGFTMVMSLPMLMAIVPPRSRPVSSVYYAPRIQQVSQYLDESELMMSDVPWAVAWYGERQSVWLTRDWQKEFREMNESHKAVAGLYVSTRSTDSKFLSNWFEGENAGWGDFFAHAFLRQDVPPDFPLKRSPEGVFAHGELLLMDRDRWSDAASVKKF